MESILLISHELRARIAEREFLLEAKVALDENYNSVSAMISFIFENYK